MPASSLTMCAIRRRPRRWSKRSPSSAISSIGVEADVSKIVDLQRLVDTAVSRFGRVDIMVNNAGVETRTSILDTPEDQYDRVMAINLRSAFFGTQIAAKHMINPAAADGAPGGDCQRGRISRRRGSQLSDCDHHLCRWRPHARQRRSVSGLGKEWFISSFLRIGKCVRAFHLTLRPQPSMFRTGHNC